jgi:hypothetical protein
MKQVLLVKLQMYHLILCKKEKKLLFKILGWANGKKSHFFIWNLPNDKRWFVGELPTIFLKNQPNWIYTDETEDYFKQYASNEIKNTGYTDYKTGDGSKVLEGAIPWASY